MSSRNPFRGQKHRVPSLRDPDIARHIRVARQDQPQINWRYPQHFAKERERYGKRTGVERAIKRLKVDLGGEVLTHRDAHRVQAHLDRKLLTLHLLLAASASQ